MPESKPLAISVSEFAERLGIGRTLAYDLVRTGEVRSVRVHRRLLIPVSALNDLIGTAQADSESSALDRPGPTT